jgi:hypothetical protein
VEETIERCFLTEVRFQPISTLSKGFKQRVCFAQSILHDPEYLIMDEPTDGLDPNQKHEVREMIREMAKDKTIIFPPTSWKRWRPFAPGPSSSHGENRGRRHPFGTESPIINLRGRQFYHQQNRGQGSGSALKDIPGIERVVAVSEKDQKTFRAFPKDPAHPPPMKSWAPGSKWF